MAWTSPLDWTTGLKVTAALMDTYVSDNDNALRAGGLQITSQAAGDVLYASSATQLTRLAIGTANKVLTTSGSVPQWSTQIVNAALPTNVDLGGTLDVTGATTLDSTVAAAGAVTVTGTSSGASVAPNSLLVLDHNDNTTLNILSGSGGGGFLDFGDADLAYAGRVLYIHTSNYMAFVTNGSEQMRITSAGYLGIGVTNPAFYVTAVNGDAGAQYTINSTHASYTGSALKVGAVRAASSAYNLIYTATGTAAGGSSGTASFVVRGDGQTTIIGNLGVGTTSVKATAHVKAGGNDWEDGLLLEHNSGDTGWNIRPENDSENSLWIGSNADTSVAFASQTATARLVVTSSGNVGVGTTAPGTAVVATGMVHSVNCVRAWGKVNAEGDGTPTLAGNSFNVTVGEHGTPGVGKAHVTFITALPHANYAITISFCDDNPKFATVQGEDENGFDVFTFDNTDPVNKADLQWTFSVISD